MQILQVEAPLVCSSRIAEFDHGRLLVLIDTKGKRQVASDKVGAQPGNWVFVVSGSAARYAVEHFGILTDLAICGIIDHWSAEDMVG